MLRHTTASRLVLFAVLCALTTAATAQITAVTAGAADLVTPPDSTEDQTLAYGLGFPFQVSADEAAVFCNLRVEGAPIVDFENGSDVVIFDSLDAISADNAIAISRNERPTDADGNERIVVKFPVIGGFVPVGALRADGTPHPHAGTGFGMCQAISFPVQENGYFSWSTERIHRCETHQFSYDGTTFEAERSDDGLEEAHPVVGKTPWKIMSPGITNAIPEGDDLLLAATAFTGDGQTTGVVRWQRLDSVWQPVDYSPVTPPAKAWAEASLIRDTDGALLFSARGSGGDLYTVVQVWRKSGDGPQWSLVVSTDDVRVWQKREDNPDWGSVINLPKGHNSGPMSIGSAADGTPFIGASLLGSGRQTLCLWPLNAMRMDVEEPIIARAAADEFGPAPGNGKWMVDHPSAAVVRLGDGQWHGLVVYRVLGNAEFKGDPPAPQSGCYVEEVISSGTPVPTWRFE